MEQEEEASHLVVEEEEDEDGEEAPILFRCPISMEVMQNPVTISTGVSYERKHIEKWLFLYNKTTCPATMQPLSSRALIPNTTLRNLIHSWLHLHRPPPPPPTATPADTSLLLSLLSSLRTSNPFKLSTLKNLHSLLRSSPPLQTLFLDDDDSNGIATLVTILSDVDSSAAFGPREESLALLHLLPLSNAHKALLSEPDCMRSMLLVLRRGSAEARLHTMTVLQKLSHTTKGDQDIDVIKSLLELLSDESMSSSTKLSSRSLDLLLDMMAASKTNRIKAIEAGAVCLLIELLPDSNKHNCEKILMLMKRLCECAEGRSVFADHELGVAAVSKKVLRVSDVVTKLGVKVLWLVSSCNPKERVIDDMMVVGTVRKLVALLHVEGRSSTKEKAMRMLKMHGGVWSKYQCFPSEFKDYLKVLNRFNI